MLASSTGSSPAAVVGDPQPGLLVELADGARPRRLPRLQPAPDGPPEPRAGQGGVAAAQEQQPPLRVEHEDPGGLPLQPLALRHGPLTPRSSSPLVPASLRGIPSRTVSTGARSSA